RSGPGSDREGSGSSRTDRARAPRRAPGAALGELWSWSQGGVDDGLDGGSGLNGFECLAGVGDAEAMSDELRERIGVLQPDGELHGAVVVLRLGERRALDRHVLDREIARRDRLRPHLSPEAEDDVPPVVAGQIDPLWEGRKRAGGFDDDVGTVRPDSVVDLLAALLGR